MAHELQDLELSTCLIPLVIYTSQPKFLSQGGLEQSKKQGPKTTKSWAQDLALLITQDKLTEPVSSGIK